MKSKRPELAVRLAGGVMVGLIALGVSGCAGPNDYPPLPTWTPTPSAAATLTPTDTPLPTETRIPAATPSETPQPGVIVSTVGPAAPATQIVDGTVTVGETAPPTKAIATQQRPTPTEQPTQGGQRDITMADNNQTVTYRVGDTFLLKLNMDLIWTIEIKDPGVIVQAQTFAPIPDAQGLFVASKAGRTVLSATGQANCKPGEVCPMFLALFQVTIVVLPSQ